MPFYRNFIATNPEIGTTITQNTSLPPALSETAPYPYSFYKSFVG